MDNSRGQIFDNLSDMLCGLGFQNRSSPQPIPSSSDTNQDSTLQGNDCYVVLNEGVNTFASNEQQPLLYQDRRSPPLPPKAKSQKKNLPMSPSSGSTRWYDDRPQEARVPDPFPELGMLSGSYTDLDKRPFLMRIYNEDGSVRTVTVEKDYLAREVCYLMVLKNHSIDDKNWVLVEQLTDLKLERCLEDHEIVLQIYQTWDENSNNRFIFRKNFLKYQLFENPSNFFPSHMIDSKEECETPLTEDAEQAKKILLERLFTNTERIPEMHGFLHCKDGNKRSWKKLFFMLRASGLYYSTKGSSKESKHLHCFSQFTGVHAYTAVNGRKHFGAPNDNVFCLKPVHSSDLREIKCLCAEDDGTRQSWITGIRLAKYKSQLRNNYLTSLRRQAKLQDLNAADYSPRLVGSFDISRY
uniref:Growth factor receptor-bound protein 14-like n=1 Tax=Saccoglossus kowalevskii TaxID=10224 RepID=A0ABM0M5X3_SACKO|nr:PREDICTED: growth factor receptor-bound protein 14-like [Saccoglossus kowalevskii]